MKKTLDLIGMLSVSSAAVLILEAIVPLVLAAVVAVALAGAVGTWWSAR